MAGSAGRKSILKKGKGRALLRFIIYLLLLFILVSVAYIIIVSDGNNPARQQPVSTASAVTPSSTPVPTPDPTSDISSDQTPDPTTEPTLESTPEPTPFTPDPSPVFEMGYSDDVEYENIEKLKPGEAITRGLITFEAINNDFIASLVVSAYAYIEGADASGSAVYLLTVNEQGVPYKMYTTQSEGSDGGDREKSTFSAKIDVTEYIEGKYSLGVVIINGKKTECALIKGSAFMKNEMDEAVITP